MSKQNPYLKPASDSVKANALIKAIQHAGSQAKLAHALGYNRCVVNEWLRFGHIGAPAAYVLSHVPGWPMTLEEMRPDVQDWSGYTQLKSKRHAAKRLPPQVRQRHALILKDLLRAAKKAHKANTTKQALIGKWDDLI